MIVALLINMLENSYLYNYYIENKEIEWGRSCLVTTKKTISVGYKMHMRPSKVWWMNRIKKAMEILGLLGVELKE